MYTYIPISPRSCKKVMLKGVIRGVGGTAGAEEGLERRDRPEVLVGLLSLQDGRSSFLRLSVKSVSFV